MASKYSFIDKRYKSNADLRFLIIILFSGLILSSLSGFQRGAERWKKKKIPTIIPYFSTMVWNFYIKLNVFETDLSSNDWFLCRKNSQLLALTVGPKIP